MNSPDHRTPWLGAVLVLVAAGTFAVNGTVSKLLLGSGLSSLDLVQARCVLAAIVFAGITAIRAPRSLAIGWRELGFVVVYGVVGVALVQWLYLVALGRMPVSISLLIEFTAPLLIALWVRFVQRRPVRGRIWVALALIMGGLTVVTGVWSGLTLDAVGLLAAGLAAVTLAAYYLLGEHAVTRRDPWSLATWSFAAAGLFWALVHQVWRFPVGQLAVPVEVGRLGVQVPGWVLLAWVVLLGTVTPFALVLIGLSLIGATRTGLIGTAEPPLAGMVAWAMIDERLTTLQILGGVIVLAGIVLAETARTPTRVIVPDG